MNTLGRICVIFLLAGFLIGFSSAVMSFGDDGDTRDKDTTYTWKDALSYCENLLLGGHDNWRLPNIKELERLIDLESSNPAVDSTYFPNTNNGLYWSGTTCSGCHKMKAFAIDFSDGEVFYGNKFRDDVYYENYVRCVRTSDAPTTYILPDTGQDLCYDWNALIECPGEGEDFYGQDSNYTINPPDLTNNGDGTISDNLTELTWEQNTEENEPNLHTYNEAITYCDELILGGQNDWRIPTRKEYSTILNFGTTSPSLDTVYFPYYTSVYEVNEAHYWTSSEYHDDSSQVWLLSLAFGLVDKTPKEPDPHRVRCVRGDTEPATSYTDNSDGTVTDNVTGLMWEQKTVPSQGCPAGEIYGEQSDEAQLLRSFRDNILNKTPEGREMIRLYYAWSPVIVGALEKDKKFKEEMKAVVDEILLVIEPR
jgi:hypothetical protein